MLFSILTNPSQVPDLLDLRRNDRQVSLQVPVQKIWHHHSISNNMNHKVADAREEFCLKVEMTGTVPSYQHFTWSSSIQIERSFVGLMSGAWSDLRAAETLMMVVSRMETLTMVMTPPLTSQLIPTQTGLTTWEHTNHDGRPADNTTGEWCHLHNLISQHLHCYFSPSDQTLIM